MDYEVKAKHYDVSIVRSLGPDGYATANRRQIRLFDLTQTMGPSIGMTSTSPGVVIVFSDVPPDDLGIFRKDHQSVLLRAHLSDFSDMYRLVQTEYPIFCRWKESPDDSGTIVNFTLHADHEPVGEGFEDLSP